MPLAIKQLIHRLTLRQLEVFRAVYEEKAYGKAADKLGLTQPAVSSQIRQLEDILDHKLFEYIGRKVYDTSAGNSLASTIEKIFEELETLQNTLASIKGQVSGELTIAAVNTAQYVVPYLIKEFREQFPQVILRLNFVNRSEALERLSNNVDDLTIMDIVPVNRPLSSIPFLDNALIPVFPGDYPLLKQEHIQPEEFFAQPLLIREVGSGSRLALEQHCSHSRIDLSPSIELGSNEALKHAVISGLGVAVLPKLSVQSELQLGRVKTRDIQGFPIKRSWCLVHPTAKSLSPAALQFIDYIQSSLSVIKERLF
ncbi:LysR family transcriptional regulator [Pleionea sediminis]|uniref:LysR family transcriptional regulator n=1 Tax=Pleionea sediminis TaxID=2569479 RepID=UPI0011851F87|nr:LysR family transcriptional regulator [Pleionea sediminis]